MAAALRKHLKLGLRADARQSLDSAHVAR